MAVVRVAVEGLFPVCHAEVHARGQCHWRKHCSSSSCSNAAAAAAGVCMRCMDDVVQTEHLQPSWRRGNPLHNTLSPCCRLPLSLVAMSNFGLWRASVGKQLNQHSYQTYATAGVGQRLQSLVFPVHGYVTYTQLPICSNMNAGACHFTPEQLSRLFHLFNHPAPPTPSPELHISFPGQPLGSHGTQDAQQPACWRPLWLQHHGTTACSSSDTAAWCLPHRTRSGLQD